MPFSDFKTPKGFEELYRKNSRSMYSLALQLTGCEEHARDVVQSIFTGVWERREHLQICTNWHNYLLRAVKLECIDHFRRKERQRTILTAEMNELAGSEPTTERQVLYGDLNNTLQALVNQLPPQCRKVYVLSREAGYNNREIAAQLKVSTRTVEFYITKALAHVRKNLAYKLSAVIMAFFGC